MFGSSSIDSTIGFFLSRGSYSFFSSNWGVIMEEKLNDTIAFCFWKDKTRIGVRAVHFRFGKTSGFSFALFLIYGILRPRASMAGWIDEHGLEAEPASRYIYANNTGGRIRLR